MDEGTHNVTQLLGEVADGDTGANGRLVDAVYAQLRKIAQVRMAGERSDHTLQPTELVHEAYLKIEDGLGDRELKNRGEFYAAAAMAMRRILIDHARKRGRVKRGGGEPALLVNVAELAANDAPESILAVDEAVTQLENEDEELGKIVRLRFYAGLSVEETARALEISPRTVKRRWTFARAFLQRAIGASSA